MAMKCSRLTWSRLLTALGGAAIAVGIGSARLAPACEVGMYPTEDAWCEAHAGFAMAEDEWMHEHAPPAPIDDLDPAAEAGYFDNGPVEDEIAADQEESIGSWYRYEFPGDADETECGYEYGNYEYEDHCADDESETAEQVAETESAYDDEWDYEYGDYAYEYEDHYAADESETAEQVAETESAYDDEWDYEYGDYAYEYEDHYADDESETAEQVEEVDEAQSAYDDEWDYEYGDYAYEYEDHYADEESETAEQVEDVVETESPYDYDEWHCEYGDYGYNYEDQYADDEAETAEHVEDVAEAQSAYDYDEWDYEYGNYEYEYEDHYADDEAETAEQVEDVDEAQSAYDYDEWEYEYGNYEYEYEDHYAADEPETAEQVEDVVESPSAYDDEWGYMYGKYDDAAEHVSEETAEADRVDSHFDDTWRYECDRYDYACPEEAYGYSPSFDVRESDEAIAPQSQGYQGYSEAYPDEEYAYPGFEEDEPFECFDDSASWDRQPEVSESGLELFAWHPTELLMASDQQVLRTLETQCEEPSGVRRASLNGYVEDLGWEAIDFASQFEDRTGIEVLGLADDLPGAAAFLGVFRLVERGELGMEEGIDLLRRSLQRLSLEWIEGVSGITADAFADPDRDEAPAADGSAGAPAGSPVVDAMLSLAVRSLAGLGGAVSSVSQSLCDLDWSELATTAIRSRSAMVNPPIQR